MDRKPLSNLTKEDLLENPVWDYGMSGNIEYVNASTKTSVTDDSNSMSLVLTDFFFNNKTKHLGFCSPQNPTGLELIQPVVFSNHGQVEFYKENDWTENEKNKALSKLGLEWNEVFPVVYKSRVKCNRDFYTGTLANFNEVK